MQTLFQKNSSEASSQKNLPPPVAPFINPLTVAEDGVITPAEGFLSTLHPSQLGLPALAAVLGGGFGFLSADEQQSEESRWDYTRRALAQALGWGSALGLGAYGINAATNLAFASDPEKYVGTSVDKSGDKKIVTEKNFNVPAALSVLGLGGAAGGAASALRLQNARTTHGKLQKELQHSFNNVRKGKYNDWLAELTDPDGPHKLSQLEAERVLNDFLNSINPDHTAKGFMTALETPASTTRLGGLAREITDEITNDVETNIISRKPAGFWKRLISGLSGSGSVGSMAEDYRAMLNNISAKETISSPKYNELQNRLRNFADVSEYNLPETKGRLHKILGPGKLKHRFVRGSRTGALLGATALGGKALWDSLTD